MIQQVGFSLKVVNVEDRAHVSSLIDKVDTMQKSRLQGPSTFHSVLKGPRFTSNALRPRSEPRKAVRSLNVPTCAFFENNLIPGELKLKTLNMEHFVPRQSGDSFCDQLLINYGTQFSVKNSSIQNGSISIGRSYSKIAFLGLRKGTPFEPQFVPKNGGTTIWEKNRGDPSLLFQQGRPCVRVMVFVLKKDKSPSGISIHTGDFETPFSRWIGGQRAVNMEHLATNSFLSDEAMRIWKPKT